jgi:integrase
MAFFEKRGDRWRVQIRRRGVVKSRTFRTKAQGREWALQIEAGITGETPSLGRHTVLQALRRFASEVSTQAARRGGRWERLRLRAMESEPLSEFVRRPIADTTEAHVGAWRDGRLKEVSPSTVKREMNLLASVFELARAEWKWTRINPFRGVKKPIEPPARRRGVKEGEFGRLAEKLTGPAGSEVLAGFELGIETGMRAGEMWSLEPEQINLALAVAHLEQTKNGDARDVALSPRAVEIIRELLADGRPTLFTITNAVRDALFRKARIAAGIDGLHFHDSRAEAVSRMSKVLKVQDLADQIGHRDLNSLMLYYKPSAADRATQLAAAQTTPSPPKPPSAASRRRRSRGSGSGNPAA